MKTPFAAAVLAVSAACVQAQPARPSFFEFHPLLAALDTNHDQALDASELAHAPEALRKLDVNGDGRITPEEMMPRFRRGPEGERRGEGGARQDPVEEAVKRYLEFDKNGDGKLTRDELPERMQGIFDRADTNKDGVLTVDELRALAQAQQTGSSMRQRPRGEEREGGEGRRGGPGRMRDPIFQALDTNHDGVISGDEITNAAAALKALDKNGDGRITEDEVRPNFGPGRE